MRDANRGISEVSMSRIISGFLLVVGVVALTAAFPVFAADQGAGVSVQGYSAEQKIDNGSIVQLADAKKSTVKLAKQSELQNMFGVVVDRNILPVTLTSDAVKNEVFVAVSGTYNVLVSDQGGPIKSGDYITLSSISGIGMKAGTKEKTVFGRAAGSFDGKGVNLGKKTLKDTANKRDIQVTLGSVPVSIDIKKNPNDETTKTRLPDFLERIGKAIAEKEVSPLRMYLSLGITAVTLIASIAVLYSGVRNSIISIGRNPMSKRSIFRALMEVILTSLLILTVGLFAVYLLLRL